MSEYIFQFSVVSAVEDFCREILAIPESGNLDQGCPSYNLDSFEKIGSKNNNIESCEYFERAFDLFKKDPLSESGQKAELAFENYLEGPIPWIIDDPELLELIDTVIFDIKEILETQKVEVGSDEYKTMMGAALYYFAIFPSIEDGVPTEKFLSEVEQDLANHNLHAFLGTLLAYGGLGATNGPGNSDCFQEASAEEALENDCGYCTENSKVLYAVFKRAGLDPYFVYMDGQSSIINFENLGLTVSQVSEDYSYHIFIGQKLSDKTPLLYDPLSRLLYPSFEEAIFLSDPGAMAQELSQQASSFVRLGDYSKAVYNFEKALALDSSNPEIWNGLALALSKSNKEMQAVLLFGHAISLDPNNPQFYENLAITYIAMNKFREAENVILNGIKKCKPDATFYSILGEIYLHDNKIGQSIYCYQQAFLFAPNNTFKRQNLIEILDSLAQNQSTQVNVDVLKNLIASTIKQAEDGQVMPQLIEVFNGFYQKRPSYLRAHNLGLLLYENEQYSEAVKFLRIAVGQAVENNDNVNLKKSAQNLAIALGNLLVTKKDDPQIEEIIISSSRGSSQSRQVLGLVVNRLLQKEEFKSDKKLLSIKDRLSMPL